MSPAEAEGAVSAPGDRAASWAAVLLPRTASATRPTSPWRWPRARGCAARRSSRGLQGHARSRTANGRVTGVDCEGLDGPGHIACRVRRQLRRHVGPRPRRRESGVTLPLHACEHFYLVTEPIPGLRAGPARAARPRRVRLLQGGRRQDDGRRLRARGQALGHGRHPPRLRVRRRCPRTWTTSSPILEKAIAPDAAARRRRASAPSSTGPRASRPTTATTSARRRSWTATGSRRATTRSASCRRAARAWRSRTGSTDGEAPFDLWEVDIRRAQPFQRNRRYLRERVTETLGLLYADHFPYRQIDDRAGRAALAAPRPSGGAGRRVRRGRGLGARQLVREAGAGARVPLLLGPAELVRQPARRAHGGARGRGPLRHDLVRQDPGRGARRLRRPATGSARPTWTWPWGGSSTRRC